MGETVAECAGATPLQRMQIREQILNVLRVQRLAVARHFVAAEANDIGDALVVRRQSAQRKIFVLEDSLERWALFPPGGVGSWQRSHCES